MHRGEGMLYSMPMESSARPLLYVGNQNYSSWSLRPWLALTWGGIPFDLCVIPMGGPGYTKRKSPEILRVSPSGTVPALGVGGETITDSLAICEWAAEQAPALWPRDAMTRALARSATAEMHAGFGALRSKLPCNIRRRTEPRAVDEDLRADIDRIEAIWAGLLARFGGPYLFGATPTIPDAFFTPVATRFRTYGIELSKTAQAYAGTLLQNDAFRMWEAAGIREPWRMDLWDRA